MENITITLARVATHLTTSGASHAGVTDGGNGGAVNKAAPAARPASTNQQAPTPALREAANNG